VHNTKIFLLNGFKTNFTAPLPTEILFTSFPFSEITEITDEKELLLFKILYFLFSVY